MKKLLPLAGFIALLLPAPCALEAQQEPVQEFEFFTSQNFARGNYDEFVMECAGAVQRDPEGPSAELILRLLHHFQYRVSRYPEACSIFEKVLRQGVRNGINEECLKTHVRVLFESQGKYAEAEAVGVEDGYVQNFLAVGPFGLTGKSIHDEVFPCGEEIDLHKEYWGSRDKIGWRSVSFQKPVREINLYDFLHPSTGCSFALAQVRVPGERIAVLHFFTPSSFKLWINGELLLDGDRYRSFLPQNLRIGIRLAEGWNRILVKLSSRGMGLFSLKLTDPQGKAFPDMAIEKEKTLHPLPEGREWAFTGECNRGALVLYEEMVRKRPDDPLPRAALSLLLQEEKLESQAIQHCQESVRLLPGSAAFHFLLASLYFEASSYPETFRKNRCREELEKTLELDPSFAPAFLVMAEYLAKDQKHKEAVEEAKKALAVNPAFLDAHYRIANLCQEKKWEREALKHIDEISTLHPGSPLAAIFLSRYFEEKGNIPAVLEEIGKSWEKNKGLFWARSNMAFLLQRMGRAGESLKIFRELENLFPDHRNYMNQTIQCLVRLGHFEEAMKKMEDLQAHQPLNEDHLIQMGDICLRWGRKEEAAAKYREALEIDPSLHPIRKYLEHLEGKDEDFSRAYEEDIFAHLPGPDDKEHPEASTVSLLDLAVVEVYPDGSNSEVVHLAQKVLNEGEGKERLGEVDFSGEILEVRTITPEGEVLEPVKVEGEYGFTMPGLVKNAVVELRYRDESYSDFPRTFSYPPFYFQDPELDSPVLLSRLVVMGPRDFNFKYLQKNAAPEPVIFEKDGRRVLVWEARNMDRIEEERMMPALEEILPHVRFYPELTWNDITGRFKDSYLGATLPTPEIRAKAEEVVRGKETELEKAKSLFAFVNDWIKKDYGGGGTAHRILLEKSGNRMILLKALLDAAGIRSRFAMASTNPALLPPQDWHIPDPSLFPARLLQILPQGSPPVWICPGPRYFPFGKIPNTFWNSRIFLVEKEGGCLDILPPGSLEEEAQTIALEIDLEESGGMSFTLDFSVKNTEGYFAKERFLSLPDVQKRLLAQEMASEIFPGASVTRSDWAGLREPGIPFQVRMEGKVKVFVEETGRELSCKTGLAPSNLVGLFVSKEDRKYPFVLRQYVLARGRALLRTGKAYRLKKLPSNLNLLAANCSYSQIFTREGEEAVVIRRHLDILPTVIPPGEYSGFIDFCREIDTAEQKRILLERIEE